MPVSYASQDVVAVCKFLILRRADGLPSPCDCGFCGLESYRPHLVRTACTKADARPCRASLRAAGRRIRGLTSERASVAARTPSYCFVTRTPVALVVSVNPAVWLVNDPLIEAAVRAVYIAPDAGGCLGLTSTLRAPDRVAVCFTLSVL